MIPSDLEVTHRTMDVGGLRMHVAEKGDGPLAILLHGFPENWWSWRYQIDPLVKAGYRVVAPDQRGYNDTEARGPYDIETLASDIRGLIRELGEKRATLIAHDWGGAVAWHLAATHPETCERLVVMNCPHPAAMAHALRKRPTQMIRSWYMFFFQLPWLPERTLTRDDAAAVAKTLRAHAIDRSHFGDDEIRPFRAGILKPGRASAMLGWYRAAVRAAVKSEFTSVRVRYPTIRCPTLLVWALDDRALGYHDLVPPTARYVDRLEIRTIDRCGHFVQQEQPGKVNDAVIEWLQRG